MNRKLKVGVIFGGKSGEHEVSLVSGESVIKNLDREKYEVLPIGITKRGKWFTHPQAIKLLKENSEELLKLPELIFSGTGKRELIEIYTNGTTGKSYKIDVVFPVLHGTFGEDGTIQGLFEIYDVPYVGSGVLGSSVGMDKIVMKHICKSAGIPVVDFLWFNKKKWIKNKNYLLEKIKNRLKFPVFVKPANLGSSVGITKVKEYKELESAINLAFEFDRRIIVEEGVKEAREIEISVLGNEEPLVSVPGEIIPSREFYSYEAKYVDDSSTLIIPAKLEPKQVEIIEDIARRAYIELDASGFARIDLLVEKGDKGKIYFNEINTIPGFTSISMYPRLWQYSGISYPQLLDKLIELAIERYEQKKQLKTSIEVQDWYK